MSYQLVVVLCIVITFLSSCSSRNNTPDIPYSVQNVHQFLPNYANKKVDESLQSAFIRRGLVLDKYNFVMPLDPKECNVDLYWQYSSNLTDKTALDLEYFYQGVELYVSYSKGEFYIVNLKDLVDILFSVEHFGSGFENYKNLSDALGISLGQSDTEKIIEWIIRDENIYKEIVKDIAYWQYSPDEIEN